MRFSSAFQNSRPPQPKRSAEPRATEEASRTPAPPPQDLPDDLDARVRLIGEWQLGEG